ncbi:MAG: 30S ribosomal protein S2 [Candidatus Portnoybacteria bacterium CG09_land_8_20_14_0_10_44_13]|uniref:Small ribosomal subunit protein uS2 n=1 Tax=Candidatus Portnoybacteria bacterium CG09_land_8_20_14_0_10_44_13 TaxID=1974811 RepID=A0A2H0WYY9_9BACT|nr:MAG: 30S ribosomal protein S2 [Candidatus Portnoybacteria bacterium CG09_land_8_20_14_0_10_44_13]
MAEKKQTSSGRGVSSLPTNEEMFEAGVHFGHQVTKWTPRMEPYIFGSKNNIHIIDLDKTIEKLKEALDFIRTLLASGGNILFVGTTPMAKMVVEEAAPLCQMPYVSERWLGGTLTNFKIILKRLDHFRDLVRKKEGGELAKYTKKEQHDFNEEIKKLERKFGGIKKLTKRPDALFVFSAKKNLLAIKEARAAGVKIVALCDTNIDPKLVDYPIPSNDDALSALRLMADYAVKAIEEGKKGVKPEVENKKSETNTNDQNLKS